MVDLFVFCYAAVSTAAITTGLYFIFTNGGKNND